MVTVNGVEFNKEKFHNGETIYHTAPLNDDYNTVNVVFKDDSDLLAMQIAKMFIDENKPDVRCDLVILYCPYERMDRAINEQLFSMKYVANIINNCKFNTVVILDPHSRVCMDLIDNSIEDSMESYIEKVIADFHPDYILYPDKGAFNKYPNVLKNINIPYFHADKTRDWADKGRLSSLTLVDAPDLKDKKVLIIDDICCLGGTAYNAAIELKKAGASKVAFYISHCEDGIFVGNILKPNDSNTGINDRYIIDDVYTADTMHLSQESDRIHIV